MSAIFNLTGNIRIVPNWQDTIGPATLSDDTTFLQNLAIANGTGTGQANSYWRDVRTVAAVTTDAVDYEDLALSVMGGTGTLSISSVRLLYLRNRSTTLPLRLLIDPASTDEYATIAAGGTLMMVGAGSVSGDIAAAHTFAIRNPHATLSVAYEILIVGVKST
jgi:hypothetical protein